MAWNITPELKRELADAVRAEGWDEDAKRGSLEVIEETPLGSYDETRDVDDEAEDYHEDSISSLIEYFGLGDRAWVGG